MKKFALALMLSITSFAASAGGNVDAGKALTVKYSCAACHGADFNSPIDPSYPRLAGQHPGYIVHALTAYKRGDGPNGRNNAIMAGQAKPLSDRDIEDLAAYLGSLPGTLTTHR